MIGSKKGCLSFCLSQVHSNAKFISQVGATFFNRKRRQSTISSPIGHSDAKLYNLQQPRSSLNGFIKSFNFFRMFCTLIDVLSRPVSVLMAFTYYKWP